MKAFFELIQTLFVDFLFLPLDALRHLELRSWFAANIINWFFMAICAYFIVFWIKQLRIFNENNAEAQDTTAHSFLK